MHNRQFHQSLMHLKSFISPKADNGMCLIFVVSDIGLCPMASNVSCIQSIHIQDITLSSASPKHLRPRYLCPKHLHPRHLQPKHPLIHLHTYTLDPPNPFSPVPFVLSRSHKIRQNGASCVPFHSWCWSEQRNLGVPLKEVLRINTIKSRG